MIYFPLFWGRELGLLIRHLVPYVRFWFGSIIFMVGADSWPVFDDGSEIDLLSYNFQWIPLRSRRNNSLGIGMNPSFTFLRCTLSHVSALQIPIVLVNRMLYSGFAKTFVIRSRIRHSSFVITMRHSSLGCYNCDFSLRRYIRHL